MESMAELTPKERFQKVADTSERLGLMKERNRIAETIFAIPADTLDKVAVLRIVLGDD